MKHSHPIIFARSSCSHCSFVFSSFQAESWTQCPQCSETGVKQMWPDVSALKLFEMTLSFAMRADRKIDDARQQLVRGARESLGKDIEGALLAEAALEAQAIYNNAPEEDRWQQSLFERILQDIQARLNLNTPDEANMLWGYLGAYTETTDESRVAVILACTFLERLLGDVLIALGITSGLTYTQAEKQLDNLQSIDQRKVFFFEKTRPQISLDAAFQALGYATFWNDWNAVRKVRNKFIHGYPWAIGAETSSLAVTTAKLANPALARLQNAYCINNPC